MADSAIKVAVRARPLLPGEEPAPSPAAFQKGVVKVADVSYKYDYAFPPPVTNEDVYNLAVADKISQLFKGYNVTILAYGSTGSGKTYTMGTDYSPNDSDIGIIPRGLTEIFRTLDAEKETKNFTVTVSFLELYKEDIIDLLSEKASPCNLREDPDSGFKVLNLTKIPVSSTDAAFKILAKGSSIRHTSATAKNLKSSRSHAIFSIYIEQTEKLTLETKNAKFQLVDLAGSERASTSKTKGKSFEEGIKINISLFSLGKVISALCDEQPHIPYRDSKLTRILQDSLGGNSHTVMIACINPSASSAEETLKTLRYACNTRKVKNRPVVNVDPPAVQIEKLKKQIESLEAALNEKQLQSSSQLDNNSAQQLLGAYENIRKLNFRIHKLEEKISPINEKLKDFYDRIKIIVEDITVAVDSDGALQSHLEKLGVILDECLQFKVEHSQALTRDMVAEILYSQSNKTSEDDCSELVVSSEMDVMSADSSEVLLSKEEEIKELIIEDFDDVSSAKYLEVTKALEMKEDMARHMQDILESYDAGDEECDRDLKKKLQILTDEKNELQASMKKTEEKFQKTMQEKVDKYEVQIKTLQEQLRKNTSSMQQKKENQVKMETLQKEIQALKRTKVEIVKQMKDNTNKHMLIQRQKDKNIVKLEREARKKDIEFSKMKSKFTNQMRVLQTKVTQATASKNKLLHAIQKKNPSRAGIKSKQSQGSLEEWIDEELKSVVVDDLVKVEVESLEKDADALKENIKKIEQLSLVEIDTPQQSDADQLKADLQVVLEQISDMRKQSKEMADLRKLNKEGLTSKSCIILDGITDLNEAKPVIEYLFKKCATAEVEAARQLQITGDKLKKQQAINESSEEKIETMGREIKALKDEMAQYKNEQERKVSLLKWDYDSKMLKYLKELQSFNEASLTEGVEPIIAKRIEIQKEEIEKLQSLRIMYENKCAEIEKLQMEFFKIKKGKRSKWLHDLSNFPKDPKDKKTRTMMEEYLGPEADEENKSMMEEYLSEESFSNDPNDPDWRLTPLYKQNKRSKLRPVVNPALQKDDSGPSRSEAIEQTCPPDSESLKRSVSSCQCFGNCKTMRCGCKKRRVSCSDSCTCDKDYCSNQRPISGAYFPFIFL